MSSYSVVGTIGSVQAYFSVESGTKSVYEQASKLPDKNCLLMELFTAAAKKEIQRRELSSAELKLAKVLTSIARLKAPEDPAGSGRSGEQNQEHTMQDYSIMEFEFKSESEPASDHTSSRSSSHEHHSSLPSQLTDQPSSPNETTQHALEDPTVPNNNHFDEHQAERHASSQLPSISSSHGRQGQPQNDGQFQGQPPASNQHLIVQTRNEQHRSQPHARPQGQPPEIQEQPQFQPQKDHQSRVIQPPGLPPDPDPEAKFSKEDWGKGSIDPG